MGLQDQTLTMQHSLLPLAAFPATIPENDDAETLKQPQKHCYNADNSFNNNSIVEMRRHQTGVHGLLSRNHVN